MPCVPKEEDVFSAVCTGLSARDHNDAGKHKVELSGMLLRVHFQRSNFIWSCQCSVPTLTGTQFLKTTKWQMMQLHSSACNSDRKPQELFYNHGIRVFFSFRKMCYRLPSCRKSLVRSSKGILK